MASSTDMQERAPHSPPQNDLNPAGPSRSPDRWRQLRPRMPDGWWRGGSAALLWLARGVGGVLRMLWKPVTLFRCAGIPIRVHITFLLTPCWIMVCLNHHRFHPRLGEVVAILTSFMVTGVILHELAHALAARRVGVGARYILLIPVGAALVLEDDPRPREELIITSAGPLASFALSGLFWVAQTVLHSIGGTWALNLSGLCLVGAWVNLWMAIFNLLPCFPMDGGRILRSLLAIIFGRASRLSPDRARLLATLIAVRYAAWLVTLGMLVLTLTVTHQWPHLILFPLLLLAAEFEYFLLRRQHRPDAKDHKTAPEPAASPGTPGTADSEKASADSSLPPRSHAAGSGSGRTTGPAVAAGVLLLAGLPGGCTTSPAPVSSVSPPADDPARRAIAFLAEEVPAWKRDNGCYSCHNNGDAARALYTAAARGLPAPPASLTDTTAWLAQPERWDDNKGDPGFSDKTLARIQFASALRTALLTGHTQATGALARAAAQLAAEQDTDGSWHIDTGRTVGSPGTYGTVLATVTAAQILEQVAAAEPSPALLRARQWLAAAPIRNTVDAAALLLYFGTQADAPARTRREECLRWIRRARGSEGGWGPYPDAPAEAFDTALVVLSLASLRTPDPVAVDRPLTPALSPRGEQEGSRARGEGVMRRARGNPEQAEIQQLLDGGRRWLITNQLRDGSWTETTRPAGGTSYAQRLSTAGWATLALLVESGPARSK